MDLKAVSDALSFPSSTAAAESLPRQLLRFCEDVPKAELTAEELGPQVVRVGLSL